MKNQQTKGVMFALIASVISGIAIFYAKISVAKIDPLVLTTSRNMVAGVLLVIGYWLLVRKKELKKLKIKDYSKLILIAIIGGVVPFYLFFTGLQFIKAPIANLIQKSLFIWVSLLAMIFLKEKLNIKYWISFALILIANFYFAKLPLNWGKGELMILAATILWSIENILAKKVLKEVSSELVGLVRMGLGSLILLIMTFVIGKGNVLLALNSQQITVVLIGGFILCNYVYFWYKALKFAPTSLVTLVLTFSVVVGNVLNGSFANVKLRSNDIFSSLLITCAIILILIIARLRSKPLRFGVDGQNKLK